MTDSEGNILTGTDGLLVGKNVAKRSWFIEGSKGLHFGDAHDAFLLAKLMPKPKWDDLPLRFFCSDMDDVFDFSDTLSYLYLYVERFFIYLCE